MWILPIHFMGSLTCYPAAIPWHMLWHVVSLCFHIYMCPCLPDSSRDFSYHELPSWYLDRFLFLHIIHNSSSFCLPALHQDLRSLVLLAISIMSSHMLSSDKDEKHTLGPTTILSIWHVNVFQVLYILHGPFLCLHLTIQIHWHNMAHTPHWAFGGKFDCWIGQEESVRDTLQSA